MHIVDPLAETYAHQHTSMLDGVLQEVEEYTNSNHPHAHMLSGKLQGRLLQAISQMIQPAHILEIGTFTGYSALCLTAGLKSEGVLHTIEIREQDAQTARNYFNKAECQERIQVHVGDAINIIPTLNFEWDLVFLDADKVNYSRYYELVLPFVRKGGWIIADNVLFHGQVLNEPVTGKNAMAIKEFNQHIHQDDRVEQVMLTIRDGLLLIRKK